MQYSYFPEDNIKKRKEKLYSFGNRLNNEWQIKNYELVLMGIKFMREKNKNKIRYNNLLIGMQKASIDLKAKIKSKNTKAIKKNISNLPAMFIVSTKYIKKLARIRAKI